MEQSLQRRPVDASLLHQGALRADPETVLSAQQQDRRQVRAHAAGRAIKHGSADRLHEGGVLLPHGDFVQSLPHGPGVHHGGVDPSQRPRLLRAFRAKQSLLCRGAKHPAAELSKIHTGGQLLKVLEAGVVAFRIQRTVEIPPRKPVVHPGLQIYDHASLSAASQLADAVLRKGAAGVCTGSAHLTCHAARLRTHSRQAAQQHRHGIVQDHDLLPRHAPALQCPQQRSAHQLPLAACDDHLFVDSVHLTVDFRGNIRRVGKAEADLIRPIHQRQDGVCCKVHELLPGRGHTNPRHFPLAQLLHPVALLLESHQAAAKIGAPGVDHRDRLAHRDLSPVAEIGRDHRQRPSLAGEPQLHLRSHFTRIPGGLNRLWTHSVTL